MKMIKRIKVEKLRPGMFVHDFDCSWFNHPFLRNKMKITDERIIEKIIQHGLKEVYIDTSKGLDVRDSALGKGLIQEIQAQLSVAKHGRRGSRRGGAERSGGNGETAHVPWDDGLLGTQPEDDFEPPEAPPAEHEAQGGERPSAPVNGRAYAPEAPRAETAPSPDAPAEEPHAEAAPSPDAPAEEARSETAPSPDAPAEEARAEAAPSAEAPAEEPHAEAAPSPDTPAKESRAEAASSPEAPAEVARGETPKEPQASIEAEPKAPRAQAQAKPPSKASAKAPAKASGRPSAKVTLQDAPKPEAPKDARAAGAAGAPGTPGTKTPSAGEAPSSARQGELPDDLGMGAPLPKTVGLEEEMFEAIRVRVEAKQIVQKIMEDAKLGKQIQMEKVHPMVGKIVDSVLRNPDALLTLSHIKKADDFTYMHSLSVCVLMSCFACSFHISRDSIIQVGIGALLHDVGKVKVPPEILHKAGKLSEDEEEKLRAHVEHGYNILSKAQNISPIAVEIATQHHEHHDGTGYPKGLKGDEIGLYGQASAVVNMYDILTSDRWWRKGMEPTEALAKLVSWSRFNFNEEVLHRFVRCIGIYPIGTLVRMESGLLGVVVEQGTKDLLNPVVRTIYDTKKQWFIKPRDIDLSSSAGKSLSDRIVCHESPDKWKIKPQAFLVSQAHENGNLSRRLKGIALNA